jgi:hypothetical protein
MVHPLARPASVENFLLGRVPRLWITEVKMRRHIHLIFGKKKGMEFFADRQDKALRLCEEAGYQALFMPDLLDMRIKSAKTSRIWKEWYSTPSIRVTGRGKCTNLSKKGGTAFVVYAHIPNYLSNSKRLRRIIEHKLVFDVGIIPKIEFIRLLDLEDREKIFVVDYGAIKNSASGLVTLKEAMKQPQTKPFFGGEKRTERYFKRYKKVYGEMIGIWRPKDSADQPMARLLFLGNQRYFSPVDSSCLGDSGRFIGVPSPGMSKQTK